MCYDFDAHPPDLPADLALLPPIAGGAGAETVVLTAADGTDFAAALAESPEPKGAAAVVVLPDVRGLYPFYAELAERFAQAGHHAIAIDYFGRTAGTDWQARGEEFDFWAHVAEMTPEQVQLDVAAAIAALRERTGATDVIAVGFCRGGTMAELVTTSDDVDLAGIIAFYGGLGGPRLPFPGPLARAEELRGPILALYGGADQSIPAEDVAAFDAKLSDAGIEHEFVTYPDAPHGFFDRSYSEHAEACADAWRRALVFADGVAARA
jgi:carboxymethylenebutenolidase